MSFYPVRHNREFTAAELCLLFERPVSGISSVVLKGRRYREGAHRFFVCRDDACAMQCLRCANFSSPLPRSDGLRRLWCSGARRRDNHPLGCGRLGFSIPISVALDSMLALVMCWLDS